MEKEKSLDTRPRIYLAGKITNNSWRSAISVSRETPRINGYMRIDCEDITDYIASDYYYDGEYETNKYIITGPHALSCDHGCFHFRAHHGAASKDGGNIECEDKVITTADVLSACTHQIDKSDYIFAYIDSLDAYGTLTEIGYAYNCRKRCEDKHIFILFKNQKIANQLWFAKEMADWSWVQSTDDDIEEIRKAFNEMLTY